MPWGVLARPWPCGAITKRPRSNRTHAPGDRPVNAPESLRTLAERLSLTREPFPASRKTYLTGSRPDLRVPMREIALSDGETVVVHDTSGPYTDPTADVDPRRGLPPVRAAWVAD